MKQLSLLISLLFSSAILLSCNDAGPEAPAPETDFTHVVNTPSAYYVGGPQQARPPDGTFAPGTEVKIILQDAGSYVLVESSTGIEAYVSTSALAPKN